MSASIKIKNTIKNFLMENEFLMDKESCNVIIPYVPSGYEAYSNYGFVDGQFKIDNFLTYKRLFTGNDAFIITWKGSTSIAPNLNTNGQIQINWQLGEYILGWNEGLSSDVAIENDASFSEYKKQSATNTLTFRIRADEYDLGEEYKYLFYKVPEVSKDILYRVVSLETEYIGRAKVCYVLRLQSLQQDLESTGRAKSQNVMSNAPGQGYYDPLILQEPKPEDIKDNINFKQIDQTRWLTVDLNKVWNNPCKKVVVKMFGLSFTGPFSMVGRKVYKNGSFNDYGIPRLIFPMNYNQATTPTLYRTQHSEDNFYYGYSFQPTIQFKKEFFDSIKDFLDINKVWPNQGLVYFDSDTSGNFTETNPISNNQYTYSLFGQIKSVGGTETYIPWNPTIHKDYEVDTRGTFGTETTYRITKNQRAIHDRMWDSYWVQKQISRLPIKRESTITFGSLVGTGALGILSGRKMPMIAGGILFAIGLLGTLVTQVPNKHIGFGISGIIPAALADFMVSEGSVSLPTAVSERKFFKLNYFMNDEEQDFITFFNTQTLNTSFQAELTDLFVKDGVEYETTLIGQTKHENGDLIFSDGRQLLVNGSEKLTSLDNDKVGFIIDSFCFQAIFKGDFSVEFLDSEDRVIWSGVYQSEAKWTGSLREFTTWKNTSIYGRENTFLEEPKPWPEEIKLAPWGQPKYDINVVSRMKEFVISRANGVFSLQNIQNAYDGLVEDNFNSSQGPSFRLFGKNYNSGGKPWVKFNNSQERLKPYYSKDKILSTYGRITKEAFFQAYHDIKIKINMLNRATEYILFNSNSDVSINKVYTFESNKEATGILVYANNPADYDIAMWKTTTIREETNRPGYYDVSFEQRSINQIFNITSIASVQHKLIFEEDGVYVESQLLEKTIKIEVDYLKMSQDNQEKPKNATGNVQLWSKKKHGFGNLRQWIITKQGLSEWIKELGPVYTNNYIDNFSIGNISAKAK